MRAVRAYFQDGTLPEEGTVCEVESTIFGSGKTGKLALEGMKLNEEDWKLIQASYQLQQNYFVPIL